MLLSLREVTTFYGQLRILEDISIEVGEGELVCLLGGNASGKSTTLKTTLGLVRPRSGVIEFDGADLTGHKASDRIRRGMAIVPENRRLFGPMTVRENLEMGAYLNTGDTLEEELERVYELFPRLGEREDQLAGTLSGGEQQMVAIGRALMARPRLLMLDEPSLGLAPVVVGAIFANLAAINRDGLTILLVEQNVLRALRCSHRAYVLENGTITLSGESAGLLTDERIKRAYLGR
jgi:branched-chain amino acid transport system ATP-binding protein